MRAFIAVEIPEHIRSEIFSLVSGFQSGIKPILTNNIHITMEFLGEIDENGIAEVVSIIENTSLSPFTLSLGKARTFGSSGSVAFMDIVDGKKELKILYESMHGKLAKIKKLDEREYLPHVSIARGSPQALQLLCDRVNKVWRGSEVFKADSIAIKKSILGGMHAEYITVFEKRFGPEHA
jgi:2'-5' RNA ligase